MKSWILRRHLILLAVGLALLYWILEALAMTAFFAEGTFVEQIVSPDRHELWMRSLTTVLIVGFGAYAQIASDRRRRLESELRESHDQYSLLWERSSDAMFLVDSTTGRYLDANPAAERFTGRSRDEILTLTVADLASPRTEERLKRPRASGETIDHGEVTYITPAGDERTALLSTIPMSGDLRIGIAKDITERRQAQEALRASEDTLNAAQAMAHVGHWRMGTQTEQVDASAELLRICGLTGEKNPMFDTFMAVIHPEDVEHEISRFRRVMEEGTPWDVELRLVLRDGTEKTVREITNPVTDETGRVVSITGTVQDITESKQAQEALKESEEKYRAIFDEALDGIVLIDAETGLIADCNREFEKLAGRAVAELRETHIWELRPSDQAEASRKRFFDIRETGLGESSDLTLQRPDGEEIAVEFLTTRVNVVGGKPYIQSAYRDITDRKILEEKLQQSQLLASMGVMTAGIAHEVNNPLSAILLYSELVATAEAPAQVKKDIRVIRSEARRASNIMGDLLTYSRKAEPVTRRQDIHRILRKVLRMRQYQQQVRNIEMSADLASSSLRVAANTSQVTQLFMNLIVNAEEALEDSDDKRIIVTTTSTGKKVRISIADSGPGIPEEHLNKVFVPFFSTKSIGKGTGLGLATCHGIVTAHGGQIRVENNDMGGATFVVELPLLAKAK